MIERLGIHYGMSFIYITLTRNLLGNGNLYSTTSTSFQVSLIYCLLIALFLTILLETWDIIKELSVHRVDPLLMMIIIVICSFIILYILRSMYYSLIIVYLLIYICKDCWKMHVVSSNLKHDI